MKEDCMAKDDYFVIAYQILAYLYRCLKDGKEPEKAMLEPGSRYLPINEKYWSYIMENLQNQGYIDGITVHHPWGRETVIEDLETCQITPSGIEYLCENSTIKKAYKFVKEAISIAPIDL